MTHPTLPPIDIAAGPESGQCCVVYGAGRSGQSAARWLSARGLSVHVHDDVQVPEVAQQWGGYSEGEPCLAVLQRAHWVVVSPGVSTAASHFADHHTRGSLLGDVELFARHCPAPILAVTGSNGKSTVVSMLHACLEAQGVRAVLAGNIGVPVLDLPLEGVEAVVLELSSFQLEHCPSLRAHSACIVNLSEDHMDRYACYDDYVAAKQRIYHGAQWCLGWQDDPATYPASGATSSTTLLGQDSRVRLHCEQGDSMLALDGQPWLSAKMLSVAGQHNLLNAAFAAEMALHWGCDAATIAQALRAFSALPHRCIAVREWQGISFVNDSKGTNVGSTLAAINGMGRRVVLIAGGDGKGADFSPLGPALREHGRAAVLIGRDAGLIAAAIAGSVPVYFADALHDSVQSACALAEPGDVVLLSPACASWDMFESYIQRGNEFVALVEALE